jgi:hypothetical protein
MQTFKLGRIPMFFIIGIIFFAFCFTPISALSKSNKPIDISVNPSFVDLGDIENRDYSFNAKVTNSSNSSSFNVYIEGKGKEFINVTPENFELKKGESKTIKIKLNNIDQIPIGPYDLSISFSKNNNSDGWVSSISSNSIRLKFNKPGISIASTSVFDVEKSSSVDFNTIFANFTDKKENMDIIATITDKENKVISEFKEKISMNSYPNKGFYGTIKMPWKANFEMGSYLFKIDGTTSDGTIIHGEKSFLIGLLKGELIRVEVEDVHKDNPVKAIARIKNVGNLKLPTSFEIVIKNKLGKEIFKSKKALNISPEKEDKISIEWPTDNVKTGEYILEYSVVMGNELVTEQTTFKVLNSYVIYISLFIAILTFIFIIFYIISKRKRLENNN